MTSDGKGAEDISRTGRRRPTGGTTFAVIGALLCLLPLVAVLGMTIGSAGLSVLDVAEALLRFDGTSREHLVVVTVRLPRVVAGLLAGSGLAVAGAIMQAVTGNPLASPGLLGINAGAAFAVVLGIVAFGAAAQGLLVWFAFAGAGLSAFLVYAAASIGRGGATPLKLVLAGAVLSSFLASLTTAILIFDARTLDQVRLWSVGSLAGRPLAVSAAVAPYILAGLSAALLLARQFTVLSLGTQVARGIGQNAALWRALAALIVVCLAGGAVAIAGPIGFVGLIVPHAARLLLGTDYRKILPFSALAGAVLVTGADALARALVPGQGLPVGIALALIGAPVFIHLARSRVRSA